MKWTLQRQSTRRVMVLFCYAMCASLLVVFWAADQDAAPKLLVLAGMLLAVIGVVAAFTWMSQATKEYAVDGDGCSQADERQIAVRNAAYRTAYQWFAGMVLSGILYANVATSKRLSGYLWMPSEEVEWQLICSAVIFIGATLPQALIAWREPDVPEEFAVNGAG